MLLPRSAPTSTFREHEAMNIPASGQTRFSVGKYEVIAQPMPHSAHMLLYSIFRDGKRIGAMASFPSESDCRFLENPPAVPPLKVLRLTNRPGRPKKPAA